MPNDESMTKSLKRNQKDLVSQTDAAKLVGIARQNIPGAFARGELDGEVVAGQLFITRRSAEREGKRRAKAAEMEKKQADSNAA